MPNTSDRPKMNGWLFEFNAVSIKSYGHITARARLGTYSVFNDRIYEMIGETRHPDRIQ